MVYRVGLVCFALSIFLFTDSTSAARRIAEVEHVKRIQELSCKRGLGRLVQHSKPFHYGQHKFPSIEGDSTPVLKASGYRLISSQKQERFNSSLETIRHAEKRAREISHPFTTHLSDSHSYTDVFLQILTVAWNLDNRLAIEALTIAALQDHFLDDIIDRNDLNALKKSSYVDDYLFRSLQHLDFPRIIFKEGRTFGIIEGLVPYLGKPANQKVYLFALERMFMKLFSQDFSKTREARQKHKESLLKAARSTRLKTLIQQLDPVFVAMSQTVLYEIVEAVVEREASHDDAIFLSLMFGPAFFFMNFNAEDPTADLSELRREAKEGILAMKTFMNNHRMSPRLQKKFSRLYIGVLEIFEPVLHRRDLLRTYLDLVQVPEVRSGILERFDTESWMNYYMDLERDHLISDDFAKHLVLSLRFPQAPVERRER